MTTGDRAPHTHGNDGHPECEDDDGAFDLQDTHSDHFDAASIRARQRARHTAENDAPRFDGAGTYENDLGAIIVVEQYAGAGALRSRVLGSIYVAHAPDDMFGPTPYLVTPEGMEQAGYRRVTPPGKTNQRGSDATT